MIYSIGARVGGGGIGNTAHHAACGLHRHGLLHLLLCSSARQSGIPASRIRQIGWPSRGLRKLAVYGGGRLDRLHDWLYDLWAAFQIDDCDVFHGWGNFCLRSHRVARGRGAVTIVERASPHPSYQDRVLSEERARWGLPDNAPRSSLGRALKEIRDADYVLIPSDFVRESFGLEGESEDKLIQVPFGTDTGHFSPRNGDDSGRGFRVLFVGQVSVHKGVPHLLEAWRRLRWADAELWLAGRVEREMRTILAEYATLPGVRFLGHVSDPLAVYQGADAFAFPTLAEGSALVTYEALACGLPVVTTPAAGSVVRDGREGFIIPARDPDALAARLESLRADEKLRRAQSQAARTRAEEFTWERYGRTLSETLAQKLSLAG